MAALHRMSPLRVFGLLALVVTINVTPLSAQEIDQASLMQDLETLSSDAMEGRAAGSAGGAMARAHIVARLTGMGIQVDSQTFSIERGGETRTAVNVLGLVPGRDPSLTPFVVSAHYDHLGVRDGETFNGADDNGSGTAGLLAIGGALRSAPPLRTVILAFFDAEEGGLRGARAFVEVEGAEAAREAIALNLNLDMVSRSEDELYVTGTYQNPSLRPVVESVEPAAGVTVRFGHDTPQDTGSDNWVMASDHGPFHQAGIPFLYFGVEDHPDYHRATDTADKVNAAWYRASVETILRVVRQLSDDPAAVAAAIEARRGQGN